jgi:hypothetical protein
MDDQAIVATVRNVVRKAREGEMRAPDIFTTIRRAIEVELAEPSTRRPAAPIRQPRWYPPLSTK